MTNTKIIQSIVNSGEDYNMQFKIYAPSKARELTEEICAFINANEGYLLIEVDNNGQTINACLENDKHSTIQGSLSEIYPALHCDMYAISIDNKTFCIIDFLSGKDKSYIFSEPIFMCEGVNSQKFRTVKEICSFFQECNKTFFDTIPCSWFNIYTDPDEQLIMNLFKAKSGLNTSKISEYIPISCRTNMHYLKSLQKKGLIEFKDVPKNERVLFN